MALRVVGAGLGRTGTNSLKLALEHLLGGSCYHMLEVLPRPDHVEAWHDAVRGDEPDWHSMFDGFTAAVDWPAGAFWREIGAAFPDAVILLSTRRTGDEWWRSVDGTIFEVFRQASTTLGDDRFGAMVTDLLSLRFTEGFLDRDTAIAAYERHNAEVRATAPAGRLVEWQPGDGWGPLCDALGMATPEEPFAHVNTTEEFRTRAGLDA